MRTGSVSIIIPTLNSARTISSCLRSIRECNYPNDLIEIIVIDSDSRDETTSIARAFNATILTQPAQGPTMARMAGVRTSAAEFIAFTDADCIVDPEWLRKGIQHIQDNQSEIVGGPLLTPPQNATAQAIQCWFDLATYMHLSQHRSIMSFVQEVDVLPTSNFITRRIHLQHVENMQWKGYGGDILISHEMKKQGLRIMQFPDVKMTHYKRTTATGFMQEMYQWGDGRARATKRAYRYDVMEVIMISALIAAVWIVVQSPRSTLILLASAIFILIAEAAWCGSRLRSLGAGLASPWVCIVGVLGWFSGYTKGICTYIIKKKSY